jgi:hypothetical protein
MPMDGGIQRLVTKESFTGSITCPCKLCATLS